MLVNIYGTETMTLQSNNSAMHLRAAEEIGLFGQRVVLQNSRYLYGTADPAELATWTTVQEGTVYFKLLD